MRFIFTLLLLPLTAFSQENTMISCWNVDDIKDNATQVGLIKTKKNEIILKVIQTGGNEVKTILETKVKKVTASGFSMYRSITLKGTAIAFISHWEGSSADAKEDFSTMFEMTSDTEEANRLSGFCRTNSTLPMKQNLTHG